MRLHRNVFINIFKDIHKVFSEYNIVYWLDAGSLLAYIREGDLFEYTSDFDSGSLYNSFVPHIDDIAEKIYNMGYEVHITKSKFTIIRGDARMTVHLYGDRGNYYGKEVVYGKNRRKIGNFINYVILEGITSPGKNYFHKNLQRSFTNFMREIVRTFRIKKLFRPIILFTTERGIFNYYPIRFPRYFYDDLLKINFHGEKIHIPKYSEKYLEYCYGKNWRIPDKNFPEDGFYIQVMESSQCI